LKKWNTRCDQHGQTQITSNSITYCYSKSIIYESTKTKTKKKS